MANIPKFGGWENDNDVLYTARFNNVRTGGGRGKPVMDPNDPQKSPTTSRGDRVRPIATNNPQPKYKPGQEFQYSEKKVQQQTAGQFHPNTPSPARSNVRPEVPARRPPRRRAVPIFAEWENPSAAPSEGYTVIFNEVREERKEIKNGGNSGNDSVQVQANDYRNYNNGNTQSSQMKNDKSTQPSCFGCLFPGL